MSGGNFFLNAIVEPIVVIIAYELAGWLFRRLFPGRVR